MEAIEDKGLNKHKQNQESIASLKPKMVENGSKKVFCSLNSEMDLLTHSSQGLSTKMERFRHILCTNWLDGSAKLRVSY